MPDIPGPYNPTPESITNDCGPVAAVVWGAVWRYCQMSGGVCWASQSTIARRAGYCRRTVTRHLRALVAAGYLEVYSADQLGRARSYAAPGRARTGEAAPAPGDEPDTCDRESHAGDSPSVAPADTVCDRKSHKWDAESQRSVTLGRTECAGESHSYGTESHTKKDSKIESKRVFEESQQDTRGVPPRVRRDKADPDDLDDQVAGEDLKLVAECLGDFFARITGIPVPYPRNEREAREARVLWWAPLEQIASLCGSTLRGQRAIAAALAMLRSKGCIVKAPISILGTALAVAGQDAKRRASWQEINERYGPQRRRDEREPSPPAGPGRSSSPGAASRSRPAAGQPSSGAGPPSRPAAAAKAESPAASPSSRPPSKPRASAPPAFAFGQAGCARLGSAGSLPASPERGSGATLATRPPAAAKPPRGGLG